MGTLTFWDRFWPWLRHPLDMASASITGRYLDRHGLVMEFADKYDVMQHAWRASEQRGMSAKLPGQVPTGEPRP